MLKRGRIQKYLIFVVLLSCCSSRAQEIWSTGKKNTDSNKPQLLNRSIIILKKQKSIITQLSFSFKGWNKSYPFNTGDLVISMNVLYNYLEANNRIPWEDLRYLFGEIMYGGHITDDWDRRLCKVILILSIIMLWMH